MSKYSSGPDMSRNQSLAGQTVKQGSYSVTYDENGMARQATNDGGKSATSSVKTSHANDSAAHQEAYEAAQRGDWDAVGNAINKIGMSTPDGHGGYNMGAANDYLEELADEFKYNANDYYGGLYETAMESSSGGGGTSGASGGMYASALKGSSGGSVGNAQPSTNNGYADALKKQQAENDRLLEQLKNLYSENGSYAEALKKQQEATQAGVEKAVNSLEGQKTDTNREYSALFRQLYLNKMRAKKNLDQQMAAQGITGGAAESTMLGLDTDYQEALRQGEEGRIAAMEDLDQAISDARLTGDITSAQLAADSARDRTNSYAAVLQNLIDRYDSLAADQANRQAALDEVAREEAANAKSYAYQTALQLLQSGNMASDELLDAAGISKADAASIVQAANAAKRQAAIQNPVKKYTASQAEVALAAALNGVRSAEVRGIIEGYYGIPLEDAVAAYGGNDTSEDEERIARAAANYRAANPNVALDSMTLDSYLTANGYSGDAAQLFKAYLEEYGAKYSRM